MRTKDYIDMARPMTKTGTDYAVAKLLGLTTSTVASYAHGRRVMDNRTALRLSLVLKRRFIELLAAAEMERSGDDKVLQGEWRKLYHRNRLAEARRRKLKKTRDAAKARNTASTAND